MSVREERFPSGIAVWTLVLTLLMSLAVPDSQATAARVPQKKVVVVLMDGLRIGDITAENTPNLWKMQRIGSVGVMNQNTLGSRDDVNSYLTIGAGAKASAPFQKVEAYGVHERLKEEGHVITGRDLYVRDIGLEPVGTIVVPQLPQIEAQVGKMRDSIVPGLLGDAVQQLGGYTAVIGNSDLGHEVHRPAALLAMNRHGVVDYGNLHAGVRADRTRPYGMSIDTKTLFASYRGVQSNANLIVMETGDLVRLQHATDLMEPAQVAKEKQQALREADQLVGMLQPEIGINTMVAVIAPTKQSAKDAPPVAPVLIAGGDILAGGLLSSNTTKREGLLTNYDLAPTFVRFLGGDLSQYPFQGQPAQARTATMRTTAEGTFQTLNTVVDSMWVPSTARNLIVKPWLNSWVGLAAVILLVSLFRRRFLRYLQPLAEAMLILPLAWLFVPLYKPHSVGETVLFSFGISLAIWVLLTIFRDRIARLGFLAALTALSLIVDVLLGAPLEKQSVLSYDPMIGARYYGIGNEYMGVLLGSVLLWLNAMHRKQALLSLRGRLTALVLFALVIYLFAAPSFGTNFGGALAAGVCFTYAMLHFADMRMRARHWAMLCLVTVAVVFGMILLNVLQPSNEQTHIGRAMHKLLSGQYATVWQIAVRKLSLNFLLLRVSAWGKLFLLFGALLLVTGLRQKWAVVKPATFFTRNGKMLAVAALAALLFNDSGVVAAALTLLYAIVPLVGAEELPEAVRAPLSVEET